MAASSRRDIGGVAAGGGALFAGDCDAAAPPPTAATACRHGAESEASFCCKHCNAADPPVGTLAQWL